MFIITKNTLCTQPQSRHTTEGSVPLNFRYSLPAKIKKWMAWTLSLKNPKKLYIEGKNLCQAQGENKQPTDICIYWTMGVVAQDMYSHHRYRYNNLWHSRWYVRLLNDIAQFSSQFEFNSEANVNTRSPFRSKVSSKLSVSRATTPWLFGGISHNFTVLNSVLIGSSKVLTWFLRSSVDITPPNDAHAATMASAIRPS